MLSFKMQDGKVTAVSAEYQREREWINRNDIKSMAQAEDIATQATKLTGKLHVPTETPNCWPRWDVKAAPAVGDAVSYAFNGDYYPDGVITSVSKGVRMIVKTDTGSTYYRRGNTGSWVKQGGTWSLVSGHIDKRNPHI